MKVAKFLILILISTAVLSCSSDSEDDLIDVPNNPGSTTGQDPTGGNFQFNYQEDIQPIMQSSCVSCHASPPVNGAPFALVTYNQVSQRANRILTTMERQNGAPGAMPPAGRLPQATIDIVKQWIADGMPEN